ncbi:hypothetical protein GQ55_5G184200 [Panicum hallii var. hallii]|uniref:Uncharacterized protein n=1 Tax=Panicum hallii var. hallii TaxID=1504633 RepID=A0A2T7DHP7_9POAL|nr:hypothetical protein GQ55_5G184200 [Panicum hallii var. hallii]
MGLAQIFQEIHPTPTTKANPFRPSHPSPTQQAVKASKRSFPPVLTRFASFHQRRPAPHLGPTPPATWRSPASPSLLLRLAFSSVPPPPPPLRCATPPFGAAASYIKIQNRDCWPTCSETLAKWILVPLAWNTSFINPYKFT